MGQQLAQLGFLLMHVSPVVNSKFIYQYGNIPKDVFVFYKGKFSKLIETSIKEVVETSAFVTGDVDLQANKKSFKSSYLLDIDFTNQYNSPYSVDYINKMFMGVPRYTFFYDYTVNRDDPYAQKTINKFFYNPNVRAIKPPNNNESERENRYEGEYLNTATLKMSKPFFYDCSESLEWLSYNEYIASLTYWGQTTWGGSYWGNTPNSTGLISALSSENKILYFSDLEPNEINYFLLLRDRFFARDTTQTQRRYVINNNYTSGTFTDTALTNEFNDVTADTSIYRIEISGLSAGQSLEIKNLNNNSGIKITWLAPSSSGVLVFNSYYGNLYAASSENDIPASSYSVEVVGNETLFFTGLGNPFRVFTLNTEILRITPSAGSNPNVKIDVLPTYD
jgi:hypothetical protein